MHSIDFIVMTTLKEFIMWCLLAKRSSIFQFDPNVPKLLSSSLSSSQRVISGLDDRYIFILFKERIFEISLYFAYFVNISLVPNSIDVSSRLCYTMAEFEFIDENLARFLFCHVNFKGQKTDKNVTYI